MNTSERWRTIEIGHYQYPGTAYRELVTPKTVEERRERHASFMVWLEEQRAKEPAPTWPERLARMQPAVLAILFGVMGWTLAGMGSPSISRAMTWWLLMYLMTFGFGGLLASVVGEMSFWSARIRYWIAIPAITAMTASLMLAARRSPRADLKFAPTNSYLIAQAVSVVPDGTSRCWRPSTM